MSSFTSNEGFPPSVWGPLIWQASHLILANYPLEPTRRDVDSYVAYFQSLCDILPCRVCRRHFCDLVRRPGPLQLRRQMFVQGRGERPGAARHRVFTWFVRVHNAVNARLGKPYTSDVRAWKRAYAKVRAVKRLPGRLT
jgi:hypothetical protein